MPRSIKSRVEALEASSGEERPALDPETAERLRQAAEESWESELELMAAEIESGHEPGLTFRDGVFYTLDGRFGVSYSEQDLAGLWGPETMRQRESTTSERWEEFLQDDAEAPQIISKLEELSEESEPPHDYGSLVEPDGERGVRQLSWTLATNPEARRLLSDLCGRRDAFIDQGESCQYPT